MDTLLIGLLGGLITGISPCILPVLPVIFLTSGTRPGLPGKSPEVIPAPPSRPYLVIAGLVVSFTIVTLAGSLLLGLLGLPTDVIRWAGIVALVILGIGFLNPRFEQLLEKPFQWLPQRKVSDRGNGFGMGLALGAVFVPCAGPVLAAIIVAGSTGTIGLGTVILTVSFAVGVAIPLLAFALAGRGLVTRIRAFRSRERALRITAGVAMIALAVGLAFNVPQMLQRLLPDYTAGLQRDLADSDAAKDALSLGGLVTDENRELDQCTNGAETLESCGQAPEIRGIEAWLNTPDGAGVSLDELRGKVVLIDFWAYSCINCQRSIPHVVAWDQAYKDAGLEVIGVHSPEYAFEKDPKNVAAGIRDFGIEYPVALDNDLSTWTNYRNRYWPAHYLIDANGTVRAIHFGEGGYAETEAQIRDLLKEANPDVQLPGETDTSDTTPELGSTTPETYLMPTKVVNYNGEGDYGQGDRSFTFPAEQQQDTFSLEGDFNLDSQGIRSDSDGKIKLSYTASTIRMVLGGSGTVTVDDGTGPREIQVEGNPGSYLLFEGDESKQGELTVTLGGGVDAYSFTFG